MTRGILDTPRVRQLKYYRKSLRRFREYSLDFLDSFFTEHGVCPVADKGTFMIKHDKQMNPYFHFRDFERQWGLPDTEENRLIQKYWHEKKYAQNGRTDRDGNPIQFLLTIQDIIELLDEAGITIHNINERTHLLGRYEDRGDYARGNCRFITYSENRLESKQPVWDKIPLRVNGVRYAGYLEAVESLGLHFFPRIQEMRKEGVTKKTISGQKLKNYTIELEDA